MNEMVATYASFWSNCSDWPRISNGSCLNEYITMMMIIITKSYPLCIRIERHWIAVSLPLSFAFLSNAAIRDATMDHIENSSQLPFLDAMENDRKVNVFLFLRFHQTKIKIDIPCKWNYRICEFEIIRCFVKIVLHNKHPFTSSIDSARRVWRMELPWMGVSLIWQMNWMRRHTLCEGAMEARA